MKNTPSGGDGMPSPSDRTGIVASPATEDTDCHFSEKNWSGLVGQDWRSLFGGLNES
jgi:hypothetical protein